MALIRTNGAPAAGGFAEVIEFKSNTSTGGGDVTKFDASNPTAIPFSSVNANTTAVDDDYVTLQKGSSTNWSFTMKKPGKWLHYTHPDGPWTWVDKAAGETVNQDMLGQVNVLAFM